MQKFLANNLLSLHYNSILGFLVNQDFVLSKLEDMQAQSSGRGRGILKPLQIFSDLKKIPLLKVEVCLLKWTAAYGSYSFQVLSMIVRLCAVVLLCNLELCKETKSNFCSAKNDQEL